MTPEDWWEIIELSDEDTSSVVCSEPLFTINPAADAPFNRVQAANEHREAREAVEAAKSWLRRERKQATPQIAAEIRELRHWIHHATGWFVDPFTEKNK